MDKVIKVVALGAIATAAFIIGWSLKAWDFSNKNKAV